MQTLKTYCRNCQSACGMEADVEDGRIVAIRGDRDHPMSAGYSCIKGQYSKALHGGEDRLVRVLRREGDGFAEVDVEEALDDIAARLRDLLDRHGARSIALYCGTALAFAGLAGSVARSWLAGIGSPELYSNFTVDQSAKWVTMGRLGLFATGKPSIDEVDAMLLFGYNPMVSHMGYPLSPIPAAGPGRSIDASRARGLKMIVVDPRRTETARRADLHLQIRPSEDATLLAAMIKLVLDEGRHDADFCNRFTTSLDRLREAVAPFTLDHTAVRTGIPVEQIVEATRLFLDAPRRVAASGTGANMGERSNLTEHLVECLNAICGNYRRAGDPIRTRGAIFQMVPDVEMIIPPTRDWEQAPKLRTADIGRINGEFPSSRLAHEILHPGEDRIRALVCVGGNPATALAGGEHVAKALRSLELLVVLDPRLSESARIAEYVIPTALPYERLDLTSYADNWFYRDFAQAVRPVVPPPDGMLEDWQIFWELARRMGTPIPFKAGPYGVPRSALGEAVDLDMTTRPSSEDLFRLVCGKSRLGFDELLDHPSGVVISEGGTVRAADEDDGARLDLCPADVFADMLALREEELAPAEFPYRLITRRSPHLINSAFKNNDTVRRRFARTPIYMNPDDIAAERLKDGGPVTLVSRYGRITGDLVADATLRSGAIAASACWDTPADDVRGSSLTSHLISPVEDIEAINFMPLQSGVRVRIGPDSDLT